MKWNLMLASEHNYYSVICVNNKNVYNVNVFKNMT